MSISDRARAKLAPADMPEHERPISEEFRIAAKEWVEADKLASLAEELKSAKLSEMILRDAGLSVNRAEAQAKASVEWREYIADMVQKRANANLARVKQKWVEMRFSEWQSNDANARRERHMGRQAT